MSIHRLPCIRDCVLNKHCEECNSLEGPKGSQVDRQGCARSALTTPLISNSSHSDRLYRFCQNTFLIAVRLRGNRPYRNGKTIVENFKAMG